MWRAVPSSDDLERVAEECDLEVLLCEIEQLPFLPPLRDDDFDLFSLFEREELRERRIGCVIDDQFCRRFALRVILDEEFLEEVFPGIEGELLLVRKRPALDVERR